MVKLRISKHTMPDKHWLKYINENGETKHVDLSGCANSFERATGYESQDGLRAVGWHYVEGGQFCYELFNIGHTVLWAPAKPGPVMSILCAITGKSYQMHLDSFAEALRAGGWKTVDRNEVQAKAE